MGWNWEPNIENSQVTFSEPQGPICKGQNENKNKVEVLNYNLKKNYNINHSNLQWQKCDTLPSLKVPYGANSLPLGENNQSKIDLKVDGVW